jgi:hypothetical protein
MAELERSGKKGMSEWLRTWKAKGPFTCIVCAASTKEPHHRDRRKWYTLSSPPDSLVDDSFSNVRPLCRKCHQKFHEIMGDQISTSTARDKAMARVTNGAKWIKWAISNAKGRAARPREALPGRVLDEIWEFWFYGELEEAS